MEVHYVYSKPLSTHLYTVSVLKYSFACMHVEPLMIHSIVVCILLVYISWYRSISCVVNNNNISQLNAGKKCTHRHTHWHSLAQTQTVPHTQPQTKAGAWMTDSQKGSEFSFTFEDLNRSISCLIIHGMENARNTTLGIGICITDWLTKNIICVLEFMIAKIKYPFYTHSNKNIQLYCANQGMHIYKF